MDLKQIIMNNYPEKLKNGIFSIILMVARLYWRVFKPVTYGARIILVTDTKVLLVQARLSNVWNLPGGGIKRNEDPGSASLRELREELGLQYDSVDYMLGKYYSTTEGKQDTIFIFVKKVSEEKLMDLEIEIQKAQWFAFDALPDTIGTATKRRIAEYVQGLKNLDQAW